MANKADTSTKFRIVSMLAAVFLLVSAGHVYLQQGSGTSSAELAALSQSVAKFARDAVHGVDGDGRKRRCVRCRRVRAFQCER